MYPTFILFLILLPSCGGVLGIGRMQSIAVEGTLRCFGIPASKVKVKLYDREVLFDTKLEEVRTDRNGTFHVSGSKREITDIDPVLNIYHKCNYNGPCVKKMKILIPKAYITFGPYPEITYNVGTLNLEGEYEAQWIDCIN